MALRARICMDALCDIFMGGKKPKIMKTYFLFNSPFCVVCCLHIEQAEEDQHRHQHLVCGSSHIASPDESRHTSLYFKMLLITHTEHWTQSRCGPMCRTCCPPKHVQVQMAPRYSFCHWFPTWYVLPSS